VARYCGLDKRVKRWGKTVSLSLKCEKKWWMTTAGYGGKIYTVKGDGDEGGEQGDLAE